MSTPTRRRSWVLWLCVLAIWVGFCVAIWPLPPWRFGVATVLVFVLVPVLARLCDSEGKR